MIAKSIWKAFRYPAGAAVRFEPGDEKEVQLVEYAGHRKIFGFRGLVNGDIDEERVYRPTGKMMKMLAFSVMKRTKCE